MPFFLRGAQKSSSSGKRKAQKTKPTKIVGSQLKSKKKKNKSEENITSESDNGDSDVEVNESKKIDSATSSEDETETAAEKRLRLAKDILAKITEEEMRTADESTDRDAVADRLKNDILEQAGKLRTDIAHLYLPPIASDITVCRWRKLSVITSIAISSDNRFIYCGTKDSSIIKWSSETGDKIHVFAGDARQKTLGEDEKPTGHVNHVLAVAVSTDGKYLASGGRDKLIHIWNANTYQLVHTFRGHKAAISGLVFRKDSLQLFSCSEDRSVKVWNLDEMAYVETLFGHEVGITGIDCLAQERVVTSGGRDNSVRLWKIIDESHLVFHGHMSSIDCVCFIDDQHFFSGAEDGSLALWTTFKKKPVLTLKAAHSGQLVNGSRVDREDEEDMVVDGGVAPVRVVNGWISAVAAVPYSDLLVSGSSDGCLRFWECGHERKTLKPLFSLPLAGYVNSLRFSSDGQFLVAGIGREHRLGRWQSLKNVKDSLCIIRLRKKPA